MINFSDDMKRYSRQLPLEGIGEAGQRRLNRSSVFVAGAGGLGSPVLLYLAAAGIGKIGIADDDTVDITNLNRQVLYSVSDIGRRKAEAAGEKLSALNPGVMVDPCCVRLKEDNAASMIGGYDFIVDATDDFISKLLINDVCVSLGKPFSHAGVSGYRGQTITCIPGESPCLRCFLDKEFFLPENTVSDGILGSVAGILGSIQSAEAIRFLTGRRGLLTGRMLSVNVRDMRFYEYRAGMDARCPVCSKKGRKTF